MEKFNPLFGLGESNTAFNSISRGNRFSKR